jgi:hypothetical protein
MSWHDAVYSDKRTPNHTRPPPQRRRSGGHLGDEGVDGLLQRRRLHHARLVRRRLPAVCIKGVSKRSYNKGVSGRARLTESARRRLHRGVSSAVVCRVNEVSE